MWSEWVSHENEKKMIEVRDENENNVEYEKKIDVGVSKVKCDEKYFSNKGYGSRPRKVISIFLFFIFFSFNYGEINRRYGYMREFGCV